LLNLTAEVTIIGAFGAAGFSFRGVVGLTAKALSCAARAHVPKPERRAACLHVKGAMQAA
jgi:hypothetical protein